MKRSLSESYFPDDDEHENALVDALDQIGGAVPTPLFAFQFDAIGQRRRWRNVVQGQSFRATLHQLRDARAGDDVGQHLVDALRESIDRELIQMQARPHDRVNFSMQAHGFTAAFQSVNFQVREFLERSLRLDALMESLANKLNSNESFDPQRGFDVLLSVIAMPRPGSKTKACKTSVGRRCLERVLQQKRCLINIKNSDELCCARAIVTMKSHCHKDESGDARALWEAMKRHRHQQALQAKDLHTLADVPEGPCGIEELKKFQVALGSEYQLLVMSFCHPFMLIFKGPHARHQIRLVKADTHYHGCTSYPAFINRSYYCIECEKGFNTDTVKDHSCMGRKCPSCNRKNCPDYRVGTMATVRCSVCNCLFFGDDCRMHHTLGDSCGKYRTCPKCQSKYKYREKKRHVCGMSKCPSCQEHVSVASHRCYIQPVDAQAGEGEDDSDRKDNPDNALMVYADIEAMQLGDRTFEPNLLCYRTSVEEDIHCLRGSDCCLQFLNELDALVEESAESHSVDDDNDDDDDNERHIIVIFHNLKGFDGIFILRELYRQHRTVTSQLTVGAKVLSFTSGPLIFKDSLCFLPMPLASFPNTFGITELKKGYFPHAFNTPENQNYVGRIPDVEFYDPEGMKDPKAKQKFEQWHADQVARGVDFDFQSEMESYCHSDVALLQAGCEAFCDQFSSIAGFNPMIHCVTIASACNLYWRREHLEPDCIAIEPLQGWRGACVNQSKVAFNGYILEKA